METPECKYGFTQEQLTRIIPEGLWDHFIEMSRGSTGVICQGRQCDGVSHGFVTYSWDVDKFLYLVSKGQ